MKTIILAMTLVLSLTTFGQEVNIFTESTLNCKKLQKRALQIDSAYIVEVPNKSAIEIFQLVEVAVASEWVNPDESFMRIPASQYSAGGTYPTSFPTHNKRGVEDELAKKSIESINSQINSFISSILNAEAESEDDDW